MTVAVDSRNPAPTVNRVVSGLWFQTVCARTCEVRSAESCATLIVPLP